MNSSKSKITLSVRTDIFQTPAKKAKIEETSPKINKQDVKDFDLLEPEIIFEEDTLRLSQNQRLENIEEETDVQNKELNFTSTNIMKNALNATVNNEDLIKLIPTSDLDFINKFLALDQYYQYFIIKLFFYLPKMYSYTKYFNQIKLSNVLTSDQLNIMKKELKENRFINSDFINLDLEELLNTLSLPDVKSLGKKFKVSAKDKKTIIKQLLSNCKNQRTLFSSKSTSDLLKSAINPYLSDFFQLNRDVFNAFYKTYLLQVFTNEQYYDPKLYLNDKSFLKFKFPNYKVESHSLFLNAGQYNEFHKATILRKELENALIKKDNMLEIKNCCNKALEALKNITPDGKPNYEEPKYLHRFSAEFQYIKILRYGMNHLKKLYEDLRDWLEFLLKHYPSYGAAGDWYRQLAHIYFYYLKDHKMAAEVLVKALKVHGEKKKFNIIQLENLGMVAKKVVKKEIPEEYLEMLVPITETCKIDVPTRLIKAQTHRADTGSKTGKRVYFIIDENQEKLCSNVEEMVIRHFNDNEKYRGVHCEGSLICCLFALFFWDIIYESDVPKTFLTGVQHAPLDMYSEQFYLNRKEAIDERLKYIGENGDDMTGMLRERWENHLEEQSIANLKSFGEEFCDIETMYKCIDTKVLSKIFERLVKNFRIYRSGFPDLFLYDPQNTRCKFVEVKGENDRLSLKQILWLNYLAEVGADVEVCHVSAVGSISSTRSSQE